MSSSHSRLFTPAASSVSHISVINLDPQGLITTWSPGSKKLHLYELREVIGKSFSFLNSPTDPRETESQSLLKKVAEKGDSQEHGWCVRKDGSRFWGDVSLSAVRSESNELLGFTQVIRDAQAQLSHLYEQGRLLNEVSRLMTWTRNQQGAFVEPQPSWEAFTGQSMEEYLSDNGQGWLEMLPPAEREKAQLFWLDCGTHAPKKMETLIWSQQSKSYCPVRTRATPQIQDGVVKWVGLDVGTPEPNLAEANLKDALLKLNFTLAKAEMGCWEYDIGNSKVKVDRTVAQLFGLNPDNTPTHINQIMAAIHVEDRAKVQAAIADTLKSKIPYNTEFRTVNAQTGVITHLAGHGELQILPGENRPYILGFNWNITPKKIKEREQAKETELFELMCHELRNPHHAMSLSIASLKDEELPIFRKLLNEIVLKITADLREKIEAHLVEIDSLIGIAHEATEEQSSIISSLTSQVQQPGKLEVNLVTFNIYQLIQHFLRLHELLAKPKGLVLKTEWVGNPQIAYQELFIIADLEKLKRILSNVLANAIQFTDKGSVRVLFAVADQGTKSELMIQVIDTGKGIDPSNLSKVVEKISPAARTRSLSKSGLDLARTMVEALEGEINLKTEVNVGSAFTIKIPCRRLQPIETQELKQMEILRYEKTPASAGSSRPLNILITDDGITNVKILQAMLTRAGHTCSSAFDGVEAVEAVQHALANPNIPYFDVILMDLNMPQMNGDVAATEIRKLEGTKHRAFIIALTANPGSNHESKALAAGMDLYLTKPVNKVALFKALADAADALNQTAFFEWPNIHPAPPQSRAASGLEVSTAPSSGSLKSNNSSSKSYNSASPSSAVSSTYTSPNQSVTRPLQHYSSSSSSGHSPLLNLSSLAVSHPGDQHKRPVTLPIPQVLEESQSPSPQP